ncbi:replicative DNA helicase loader DnaB [Alteribacillus persepolensis]|uniref:Replicative DNA helicase loader DnaB n=1 Tax=Alteribacillus persepolensis TaxID=568899 RepID=A0A1G8BKA9_9BACI|nr:DnaD domain protein [Alteribacillus persepolensis]SDH33601.1 replicative DNA helicase loader DnaB [Alteribacillus persepolensis]
MKLHWTELLPIDRFCVRTKDQLGDRDYKVLQLLYQPLTGVQAISLYNYLWSKLEKDSYWSREATHHEMMAMLHLPLDDIFQARRVLEGIGLLRTFRRKEETSTFFVYELQPPMTPSQFFQNDVLSVFLYNKLGKERYIELRNRFVIETVDTSAYSEVTAAFDDVFASLQYSEIHPQNGFVPQDTDQDMAGVDKQENLSFNEEAFDFDLLKADLPVFIDADKILHDEIKTVIRRLAFVYQLDPLEMSRVVQQSLSNDDTLNQQELRKKVQEWYRFEHGNEPPALGLRTQPQQYRTMTNKEPVTETEKMAFFYEQTSPIRFLEMISDGAKVPMADVKLVETLIFDYQLQPGVVNVLIDYVLKTNNMKLHQNLVQKIAGHWSRKQIQTVKEAMELAKKEYRAAKKTQQHNSKSNNQKGQGYYSRPYVRKDKLPKWLEKDNQQQESKTQRAAVDASSVDDNLLEQKQQFEEMLRRRKSIRQK